MKICVIGAGRWGKNHIRTLSQLGNLGGIVESNSSTLKEFSLKYPDVKLFEKLQMQPLFAEIQLVKMHLLAPEL